MHIFPEILGKLLLTDTKSFFFFAKMLVFNMGSQEGYTIVVSYNS
jgi:hypothetical protein